MERNAGDIDLSDRGECIEVEEWLAERSTVGRQREAQNSAVFYKRVANNTVSAGSLNELSTNVIWLRENAAEDVNLSSESEAGLAEAYLLIEGTTNLQSTIAQDPLSVNDEDSTESSIKLKQKRDAKSLKEHTESMKRMKQPQTWKVNVKKNARLKGEEYIGVGGKIVPAKQMGHPCICRMHCADKIDEKEREELHKAFWKTCTWQQRKQYIALSVKESPKQRTRLRKNVQSERSASRCRQVTYTYTLLLKGEVVTVCKSMFLSTFAVSEKFVRHVMEKKRISPGGIIGPDQRGRHTPKTKKSEGVRERVREHIKSFPTEKSTDPKNHSRRYLDSNLNIVAMHKLYVLKCKQESVPESDIVKESYYRDMFKTEFNLGFKRVQTKEKKPLSNN